MGNSHTIMPPWLLARGDLWKEMDTAPVAIWVLIQYKDVVLPAQEIPLWR